MTVSIAHPLLDATIAGELFTFPSPREKFAALAEAWLNDQAGKSRIDFSHPAHLQIVGMGQVAIPLLLEEVERRSGNWFAALRHIVGRTPVPPGATGDFEAARSAWLRWGRENGYWPAVDQREGPVDATATSEAPSDDSR